MHITSLVQLACRLNPSPCNSQACTSQMNLSDEVDLEDYVGRPDKISNADIAAICQEVRHILLFAALCCRTPMTTLASTKGSKAAVSADLCNASRHCAATRCGTAGDTDFIFAVCK